MSNDPYRDGPADPAPGWGQEPPPTGYDQGPGHDPAPGWGGDPMPAGGQAASVGKRFGAFLLDALGLGIIIAIVLAITPLGGNMLATGGASYVSNLIMAIAGIAYFALMEAGSGQTVAKRLLHLKVVREDGAPVTIQEGVMRRLPFYVGSLIPGAIGSLVAFGLLLAILITAIQDDRLHQGLHDRWAKTRVIDV